MTTPESRTAQHSLLREASNILAIWQSLRGSRLVVASETEKGRRWDESKIKSLTGGDKITARFMRQNFFEFVPTFKVVISGKFLTRNATPTWPRS